MSKRTSTFISVRTEGGILPSELLSRLQKAERPVAGAAPGTYHQENREELKNSISRAWSVLRPRYLAFNRDRDSLPAGDPGTTLTRERFLLPLFNELGFGRLGRAPAEVHGGKSFAVSHRWQGLPIHLIGCKVELDSRDPTATGAARVSPHGLMQEYLNRDDRSLWGIVSNGLKLRLLRDSVTLTRQAYVEFDLETLFSGEHFHDFSLLYLLCHQSRFEGEKPEEFIIEQWVTLAREEGTRALDQLRRGVETALQELGTGFLEARENLALKEAIRSGGLSTQEFYRNILRLVYRLIFLMVAEDRDVLLDPSAEDTQKERYLKFYSVRRLRTMADRIAGSDHTDLYRTLSIVFQALGQPEGQPGLALKPLGSALWSEEFLGALTGCTLPNRRLLSALRALTTVAEGNVTHTVDYRNLGSEELGSIYESLLELHPVIEGTNVTLKTAQGNERKTTGSYYTPTSLISSLLDTALDPVVEAALQKDPRPETILRLKICDPACGSGHFLIAAAHRLAKRLASLRAGGEEPSPEELRHALRDVIGNCIHGVDLNPMAVELCKVSLWLEAIEPGKPLSFLDHRILVGNSLLGATPRLLDDGIPNAAFEPLLGDDKKFCSALKKRNKNERENRSQMSFFEAWDKLGNIGASARSIDEVDDSTIEGVIEKQRLYEEQIRSSNYRFSRLLPDAWCAAFVWPKTTRDDMPITEDDFRKIEGNPHDLSPSRFKMIQELSGEYQFFHWYLAFPNVFRFPEKDSSPENAETGWNGGFDVVLGNPPWERIKIQEKEWFAARVPEIAAAQHASERQRMIRELEQGNPAMLEAFHHDVRRAEGESSQIRGSNRFPLTGRGDINTYALFAETATAIVAREGRSGIIVPSGVATDDTTKHFFRALVDERRLVSLFDFENREDIFKAVDSRQKFCLLTTSGFTPEPPEFVFFAHQPIELTDPEKRFTLSATDFALLNPNTRTCPIFRSRRDAEICKDIYKRVPVFVREDSEDGNPWGVSFSAMFHMSNDSGLFRTRSKLEQEGYVLTGNVFSRSGASRYLPLYEAKMIHHFDHRWATYDGLETRDVTLAEKQDPAFNVLPRYWVPEAEVEMAIPEQWPHQWLLGWRDICRSTDERTVIASVIPRVGVGNKVPLIFSRQSGELLLALATNLSSFALDFSARQKVGGTTMNYFLVKQFPILTPEQLLSSSMIREIQWRILSLYSSSDESLKALEEEFPAISRQSWQTAHRLGLRCELDAIFFHLYGIPRADVEYIMETFPIVKRNDEKLYSEYRTKNLILAEYDKLN